MSANTAARVSVGIVDDHQAFAEALALVIDREPDLRSGGLAHTCAEARALVAAARLDILLLDVALPDGDGLALLPELLPAGPPVLVLTAYSEDQTLLRALEAGASGFLGKNRPVAEVLAAIRQAAHGEMVIPKSLLISLLARMRQRPLPSGADLDQAALTAREKDILQCLARGLSTSAIVDQLHISTMTVRTHIRNLTSKLGAHSRLEAVALAIRQKIIEPPH